MFSSPDVPVTINGKQYALRWTLDSMIAAERIFGLAADGFSFTRAMRDYSEQHGKAALAKALGFCMLQSCDDPPSLKDLGRLDAAEGGVFLSAVYKAMDVGSNGGLEKKANAAVAKPEAESASVSDGTGAKRSRKRSTAVV